MLLVRQVLAFVLMALLMWFFYGLGKSSCKSIPQIWLRYGVITGISTLVLLAVLTPLGGLFETFTDLSFEREGLFKISLSSTWRAVFVLGAITVPGFAGIWIGSKSKNVVE